MHHTQGAGVNRIIEFFSESLEHERSGGNRTTGPDRVVEESVRFNANR